MFIIMEESGKETHITKEYLGRGITAALIAATLLKQKEHRHALWKQRRILRHCLRVTDSRIRSFLRFSRQIERLLRFIEKDVKQGILVTLSQEAEYTYAMTNQLEEPTVLQITPDIDDIIYRAKHHDIQVLPQVRQLIDQKPELWLRMMDLAHQAQETQLNALAGDDQIIKSSCSIQVPSPKKRTRRWSQ